MKTWKPFLIFLLSSQSDSFTFNYCQHAPIQPALIDSRQADRSPDGEFFWIVFQNQSHFADKFFPISLLP